MSVPAHGAPAPVDPASIPALRGVFAPVHDEHDDVDLEVEGELPAGLAGAYVRNGPNPLYPPLGSYTYPLDGDGMVHGMFFEDGRPASTPWARATSVAGPACPACAPTRGSTRSPARWCCSATTSRSRS